MKKLYVLDVKGKNNNWSFEILAEEEFLSDWEADGLSITEVENSIPYWASSFALLYCSIQDFINFKNPFKK